MDRRILFRVLQIHGMTSSGSESKIEDVISAINGVDRIKASFDSSNVYVTYNGNITKLAVIIGAIERLGFTVLNNPSAAETPGAFKAQGATNGQGRSGDTVEETLSISGMSCAGCEERIEDRLKELDGVIAAKASYADSSVKVSYNRKSVSPERIIETIENMDYKVKNKTGAGRLSVNKVLGLGIIVLAAYVIAKNTAGFGFIPQISQNMGYGMLFIIGLITSLHCIAMCGGINLSQCVSYKQPAANDSGRFAKLKPSLLYNTGRVMSYTIIGGAVGALGSTISFSGLAKGIVAVISGIFMVIMGLNMLNVFPWLKKLNPRIPKIFRNRVVSNRAGSNRAGSNRAGSAGAKRGPFYIGLLNGLMPCGPLQAMQIYALGTGSVLAGALSMFVFSLGTIPLMFGFGAVSSLLSGKFTHRMMKASAVLVLILGLIMLNRGLNLSGINVAYASSYSVSGNVAKIEGDTQTVTTKLEPGSYPTIIVQKGIPVKWDMKAESRDLNGCNEAIVIPKLGMQSKFEPGDNLIEFIPDTEGNIAYTCWMGMISGNIKVVTDLSKVSQSDISEADDSGNQGALGDGGGGGCCGR